MGWCLRTRGYSAAAARESLTRRECHAGVILKNKMQGKDRDKDRWLSAVRRPFEGMFAWLNKKARYRGTGENQFRAFMQAFAYNIKGLTKIASAPIPLIEA